MKKLLLTVFMWFAICGMALAAVNINTATKDELVTLKGIGPTRAQEIIDYRTKNGPFKTVDDLEKVKGIGPGTMKQIRSQISVSGPTTVDKSPASTKAKATTDDKKTSKTTDSGKGDATKSTKTSDSGKSDTKSAKKVGE